MADERGRVVITGMGAMTPLGETPEEYWKNLAAGMTCIGPMTLCHPEGYPVSYKHLTLPTKRIV